jgi:hypothetical protein
MAVFAKRSDFCEKSSLARRGKPVSFPATLIFRDSMRKLLIAALSASLLIPTAVSAADMMAPGKPAGVHKAQVAETSSLWLVGLGVVAVVVAVAVATSGSDNNAVVPPPATTT